MFYFHIGTHKTGSSTLQRFFTFNREALAAAGVHYPEVGHDRNGHHEIARELRGVEEDDVSTVSIEALKRLAADNPEKTFLISSEGLEMMRPGAIKSIVGAVRPHEVRVIVYVRDFTRLMPSKYAQRTKGGRSVVDFDTFFLAHVDDESTLGAYGPSARWASVVGWENVRVRALDPRSLQGGDLITDALDAIGIGPDFVKATDPESRVVANTAPHWTALEAVRAIASHASETSVVDGVDLRIRTTAEGERRAIAILAVACRHASASAGLIKKTAQYLTPEQWAELARRYQADVELFALVLPDQRLPDAEAEPPPPRPFLPSIEALAPAERVALRRGIAANPKLKKWPEAARERALSVIAEAPPPGLHDRLAARAGAAVKRREDRIAAEKLRLNRRAAKQGRSAARKLVADQLACARARVEKFAAEKLAAKKAAAEKLAAKRATADQLAAEKLAAKKAAAEKLAAERLAAREMRTEKASRSRSPGSGAYSQKAQPERGPGGRLNKSNVGHSGIRQRPAGLWRTLMRWKRDLSRRIKDRISPPS